MNGDLARPEDDDHLPATTPPGDGDDGATAGDDPDPDPMGPASPGKDASVGIHAMTAPPTTCGPTTAVPTDAGASLASSSIHAGGAALGAKRRPIEKIERDGDKALGGCRFFYF
jgi:hypothetical protein